MSLKRKFKTERAPLVDDAEVKRYKEKYAQSRKSRAPGSSTRPKQCRPVSVSKNDNLISCATYIWGQAPLEQVGVKCLDQGHNNGRGWN